MIVTLIILVGAISVLLLLPVGGSVASIPNKEGKNPSQRNNNPGNLVFKGQKGAIGQDSAGFAIFATINDGWKALERQITLDAGRGHTLHTFVYKYAPPETNDTEKYIRFLMDEMAILYDSVLIKDLNLKTLSKAIAKYEGFYV
jgi:hypothetical protein